MSEPKEVVLEPPFTALFCASSGSGKTHFLKHLLKHCLKEKFDNIFIMCPSLEFSQDYDEFRDKKEYKNRIFGAYDEDIISEIMAEQRYVIKKYSKARCPQTLLILDDCLMEVQTNHNLAKDIFFRGRHINLSCIVLVQKLLGVSTIMRVNTKYVCMWRCGNSSELEHLLSEYTGKKERRVIEEALVEHFKKPWSFLLMDAKTQKFEERYALGENSKIVGYIDWLK